MPASHRLLIPIAPYVHLLSLKPGQTAESVLDAPSSLLLKTLDGRRCRTKAQVLAEVARILSFPDYFDPNWDALEECLCDLDWLQADGYVLVVRHADLVLAHEPMERPTWVAILRSAGKHWAAQRPPRPFHTVFVTENHARSVRKTWRIPPWRKRR